MELPREFHFRTLDARTFIWIWRICHMDVMSRGLKQNVKRKNSVQFFNSFFNIQKRFSFLQTVLYKRKQQHDSPSRRSRIHQRLCKKTPSTRVETVLYAFALLRSRVILQNRSQCDYRTCTGKGWWCHLVWQHPSNLSVSTAQPSRVSILEEAQCSRPTTWFRLGSNHQIDAFHSRRWRKGIAS